MQTNETKKTLSYLNILSAPAMRQLHHAFGFDFCADLTAFRLSGKLTAKRIYDALKERGFVTTSELRVAVLLRNSSLVLNYDRLYGVQLCGGEFDISEHFCYNGTLKGSLGYFWRKKDFEDRRKRDDCAVIVIAQSRRLIIPGKLSRGFDPYERYAVRQIYTGTRYANGNVVGEYIQGLDLCESHNGGWQCYYHGDHKTSADELLDKSGYLRRECENELIRRINARRDRALKEEYLKIDHSARLTALKSRIFALRDKLAADLAAASTYAEMRKVSVNLTSYTGLDRALEEFEELYNQETRRELKSEQDFCWFYSRIAKILDEVEERMKRVA